MRIEPVEFPITVAVFLLALVFTGRAVAQDVIAPTELADKLIVGEIDVVTANYAPIGLAETGGAAARERLGHWIRAEFCNAPPGELCSGRPARSPSCEWEAINLGWGAARQATDLNVYTAALMRARSWLAAREAEISVDMEARASSYNDWRATLMRLRSRDQSWRRLRISMRADQDELVATEWRIRSYMASVRLCQTDRASAHFARDRFEQNGWPRISEFGAEADESLWLLVQHGPLDLQRVVLSELERLYPIGETNPRNFAMLFDRVRQRTGQPQRYGSQYTCSDGEHVLFETEAVDQLNERREAMGMPAIADAAARRCRRDVEAVD